MWVAGFDPGGVDKFGWAVGEVLAGGRVIVRATGITGGAADAVYKALQIIPSSSLAAAGIDSPLCWSLHGDRVVDVIVRNHLKALGCSTASGTVQHVNSLQGACLVQGILTAKLLRDAVNSIRITESHPKALLWLLGVATVNKAPSTVKLFDLKDYVISNGLDFSEHERDAVLGALAAAAMLLKPPPWRDILIAEPAMFAPVPNISYWMPLTEQALKPKKVF